VANLREPSATFNRDLLVGARWFAGKERTVTEVRAAARLEPAGADGAAVELVDVDYADGGTERYALALRNGTECAGDDALWPALARAAGVDARGAGRFLAEDLSNTVVLLDDAHVLKLYRRPETGIHPEVELLGAIAGTPHAPALQGTLVRDGVAHVSVQAYAPGEPVGWEPLIAGLAAGDPAPGLPTDLALATAALHRVLAARLGLDAGLQRVHGDLHVGQFLRAGDTLVVVDWEGRPGLSLAERRRPRPTAHDLATLRLSLAHAARAAHRRTPAFDWRAWSRAARDEALRAYGPVDAELLHSLEVEAELAELEYAKRWLPEWLYVPQDVLPFVLEERT
jgi:maltokinase